MTETPSSASNIDDVSKECHWIEVDNPIVTGFSSFNVSSRIDSDETQKSNSYSKNKWLPFVLNPFAVLFLAFFASWIYALIPNTNYWVYSFVKNQWWVTLGIGCYVEIQELCLLDARDTTYVLSYALGFMVPLFIHALVYFTNEEDSYAVNAMAPTSSVMAVIVAYGVDAALYPVPMSSTRFASLESTQKLLLSATNEKTFFDTFDATNTEVDVSAVSIPPEEEANSYKISSNISSNSNLNNSSKNNSRNSISSTGSEARKNWLKLRMRSHSQRLLEDRRIRQLTCPQLLGYYLPRFVYARNGVFRGAVLVEKRWKLHCLGSMFLIIFNGYYYFLVFFSEYFRRERNHPIMYNGFLFLVYVGIGSVFRVGLKRCGMNLDSMKMGSCSMFFVGEVMGLLFYYTFYRVLFESVTSWEEFFMFQFIHIVSEWVQYPFRASRELFLQFSWLNDNCSLFRGVLLPQGVGYEDWLSFIALDFGIRCSIMVCTGVSFLLLFLTIDYVPWIASALYQDRSAMIRSLSLIGIAVALEIVNAIAMNLVFFVPRHVAVQHKVMHCFSDVRFCVVVFFIASCLFINPIFAFTTENKF